MKKLGASLFVITMLTTMLTLPVLAVGGRTYTIEQGNFTVTIPSYFDYCITKDSEPTDDYFVDFSADYDSTMQMFNQGYAVDAVTDDISCEMVVMAAKNDEVSSNIYSDKDLLESKQLIQKELSDVGIEMIDFDVVTINENKYIKISTINDYQSYKVYGVQYGTVQNNTAITIDMRSYTAPVSSEQLAILEEVVNSVTFLEKQTITGNACPSVLYGNPAKVFIALNFAITAVFTLIPAWLIKKDNRFKFSRRKAMIGSVLLCTIVAIIVSLLLKSTAFNSLGVLWYIVVYFIFRHGDEPTSQLHTANDSDLTESQEVNAICGDKTTSIQTLQEPTFSKDNNTNQEPKSFK